MFCVNCGRQGQGEDEFCSHCGTKLRHSGIRPANRPISSSDVVSETPNVARSVSGSGIGIGLSVESITPELRSRYGISAQSGVAIVGVFAGGIAFMAGAQVGDVLVAFDSIEIRSPSDYEGAMSRYFSSGRPLKLSVVRGDAILQLHNSLAPINSEIRQGAIGTTPLPIPTGNVGGHWRLSPLVVILIGIVIVGVIFTAIHYAKSGSGGDNSQAYIAGWNEIAPADIQATFIGSTSNLYLVFLPNEPLNSLGYLYNSCQQAYGTDGSSWLKSQWIQGCDDALNALSQAQNANGKSATITTK